MEELKALFGDGSLTYDEFEQKLGEATDIKLANIKKGEYVSRTKYAEAEKNANDWHTKYDALTESTKDYETMKTNYETLSNEHKTLLEQVDSEKKMNLVLNANVNPKFAKFVMSEVSAQTSDGKDFQKVLEEYLNENKEFLSSTTPKGTFVDLEHGTSVPKSPNDKMNKLIRGSR